MSDKAIIEIDCDNCTATIRPVFEVVNDKYLPKKSMIIAKILIAEIRMLLESSEDELNLLVEKIDGN